MTKSTLRQGFDMMIRDAIAAKDARLVIELEEMRDRFTGPQAITRPGDAIVIN